MIGVGELTTYWRAVPAIGAVCGAPSNRGAKVGPPTRLTTAVCGMALARRAASACGVPATETRTPPAGESAGIFRKSAGSSGLGTKVQGPSSPAALNQRPASRT